jgi:hypothetical protein
MAQFVDIGGLRVLYSALFPYVGPGLADAIDTQRPSRGLTLTKNS